jgi:mannose-6-phosphate isomerase class I
MDFAESKNLSSSDKTVAVINSNYDLYPTIQLSSQTDCYLGWQEIVDQIARRITPGKFTIAVESYPGVPDAELSSVLREALQPSLLVHTTDFLLPEKQIDELVDQYLGKDPVFGRMNSIKIDDFFDHQKLSTMRREVATRNDLVIVVGTGASLVAPQSDLLILAEVSRWNLQKLQRENKISNLGSSNYLDSPGRKYKRAFFVDWRSADRLKVDLFSRIDLLLDMNEAACPKMISGTDYREALKAVAQRPFRVVPFFDPGPWGGQWMKRTLGLPDNQTNYAWCFDCVPEENSLRLGFGSKSIEVPALDLILLEPERVLGPAIFGEFGAEFPIRFDFLDTVEGGNLSLQVHPLCSYIKEHFGIPYTQDESYYILDQEGESVVYLGIKEGVDPAEMAAALRAAQNGGPPFEAERFVNIWPSNKHDHFSVPGGTVHCSGSNNLVLEISATPYIFTFKLWDWGRMGLNGKPRPIHLDHGLANIQWNRTTDWVRENLFNKNEPVASGDGWREERTGVHHSNFLETRRHWFTDTVPHDTQNTVNVLNLVAGEEVVVESPTLSFEPFVVHYAETFIVPASVGSYTIRPTRRSATPYATIKAFVRGTQSN